VKRSVIAFISLAVLAGFGQLAAAQSAPGKIGVVSIDRLMLEAPQARAAQTTLQTEFAAEEREINTLRTSLQAKQDKLNKDRATMTEMQYTAAERELRDGVIDLQAKQEKVEDKFNARRDEERAKLNRVLLEEVQKYARANSYSLILADGVLFADAALDITGPVLEALKARPATAAPAAAPAPARPASP
jgi:outer membrane protein